MKNILFIFILIITLFSSCEKDDFGSYTEVPPTPEPEPIPLDSLYTDGGVLPGGIGNQQNELVGTTWVIVKYNNGFVNESPNDTLRFKTNSRYTFNGGADRIYSLSGIVGSNNKSLTLYFLATLGGSNYSGQVGYYFVEDGFANNIEFLDIQDNSKKYKVWMKKI
jgi:hypothetical protein